MKATSTEFTHTRTPLFGSLGSGINNSVQLLKNWVRSHEPVWEYNRLGITATGIFIQVTFAGAMMLILAAAGASPFCYSIGIFFAFLADSIAFAQAPMRWILVTFFASIVVNLSLTLYYGILLIS